MAWAALLSLFSTGRGGHIGVPALAIWVRN